MHLLKINNKRFAQERINNGPTTREIKRYNNFLRNFLRRRDDRKNKNNNKKFQRDGGAPGAFAQDETRIALCHLVTPPLVFVPEVLTVSAASIVGMCWQIHLICRATTRSATNASWRATKVRLSSAKQNQSSMFWFSLFRFSFRLKSVFPFFALLSLLFCSEEGVSHVQGTLTPI